MFHGLLKHTLGPSDSWPGARGDQEVRLWSAVYNREFLGYDLTRGHVLQPAEGRHCILSASWVVGTTDPIWRARTPESCAVRYLPDKSRPKKRSITRGHCV